MNNQLVKFGLLVAVVSFVAYLILKPIVYNEEQYKVVFVNISEHAISSAKISGSGQNFDEIGPIHVGMLNDFIFTPLQNGALKYTINQNGRELTGVIKDTLKKNEIGEIFVVVSEMYKVSVKDEFETWVN